MPPHEAQWAEALSDRGNAGAALVFFRNFQFDVKGYYRLLYATRGSFVQYFDPFITIYQGCSFEEYLVVWVHY